jgi:hypothetical protein
MIVSESDPVVFEVRGPERVDIAVAQVIEGGVFPLVTLAAVDGEFALEVANGVEERGEPAAGLDLWVLLFLA